MNQIDQAALALALETQRLRSKSHRQQIDDKLASEGWREAAEFAAYSCQNDSLQLKPWETPPVWVDDVDAALNAPEEGKRIRSAALLLKRMQELGISRYHPDPLAAIERVEKQRRP